ncbi:Hypp4422 [Branchiostoma lanceolatum]|uniref:Hypp4422 protein n=1 Tax=Branchiostoma lanceolatum TaxID=7740 RepID=A0A8K0F148_BRALA|nr:Hypp4422 [Branchiostoma lanceolatum]
MGFDAATQMKSPISRLRLDPVPRGPSPISVTVSPRDLHGDARARRRRDPHRAPPVSVRHPPRLVSVRTVKTTPCCSGRPLSFPVITNRPFYQDRGPSPIVVTVSPRDLHGDARASRRRDPHPAPPVSARHPQRLLHYKGLNKRTNEHFFLYGYTTTEIKDELSYYLPR